MLRLERSFVRVDLLPVAIEDAILCLRFRDYGHRSDSEDFDRMDFSGHLGHDPEQERGIPDAVYR